MGLFDSLKTIVTPKTTPAPTTPVAPQPAPKIVLIVEDDQLMREFYKDAFIKEGYEVYVAENGQIGLEMVKAHKPNVVLLDLIMPVMDGKTMLHTLRGIPEFKQLPIIVLTNAGDAQNIRETKFYDNANEFLIKSNVTPEEIVGKVKMMV